VQCLKLSLYTQLGTRKQIGRVRGSVAGVTRGGRKRSSTGELHNPQALLVWSPGRLSKWPPLGYVLRVRLFDESHFLESVTPHQRCPVVFLELSRAFITNMNPEELTHFL
jgi:hypothetical protein